MKRLFFTTSFILIATFSFSQSKLSAQAADAALKKQRATYNKLILKRLQSYLDKNPDIRFTQALHNLDIIMMGDPMPKTGLSFPKDTFYEEPVVTSERVEKAIKKLN